MRLIRALGATLALAFLLIGIPWLLLQVGNPTALLNADWATSLFVAMDSRLVVAALSVVGWVAWAVLALTVVFELLSVATRRRVAVALPGTGWLRPVIGALVLAAVAAPNAAVADTVAAPGGPADASGGRASVSARAEASVSDEAAGSRTYLVQPGDGLWGVAEQELGEGGRWRELVALNPGLTESTRLEAGTRLVLPEEAAVVAVEEGDTLWSIAADELGDPERWPEIHRLNQQRITDPDQIDTGWVLSVPVAAEPVVEVVPVAAAPADPLPDEVAVESSLSDPTDTSTPSRPPATPRPDEGAADPLPGPPTVAPSERADEAAAAVSSMVDADDGVAEVLGPIGAILASGIVAGLASRRRLQLLGRAMGRRAIPVSPPLARFWAALARRAEEAEPGQSATAVVLGWTAEGETVAADVERERALILTGPATASALAAVVTGLSCAPWADETQLVLVGGTEWADALDDPRISATHTVEDGVLALTRLCSQRRLAMAGRTLPQLREDADLAGVWQPVVVVFVSTVNPVQLDAIADALALGEVGVSVVVGSESATQLGSHPVTVDDRSGTWRGQSFTPQLLTQPARRAVLELFRAAGSTDTEQAPWWRSEDELPPNVTPLPHSPRPYEDAPMTGRLSTPEHPMLLLLGDPDLIGAAGDVPGRAVGQCLEYCAWLLENPGSTPTAMTRALLIAETTRRSNTSRLRSWLGDAPDGVQYLPDAYSGRVSLDPRVSSDWEQFRTMLSGGVNLSSDAALVAALRLVRGEPLGSFEFQWGWAHQLRSDMVSMVVDAASVLADRALERSAAEAALWAVRRGRLAAPSNDALASREILALALAGRSSEANGAAVALTRTARAEGRDLAPDLSRRIQAALHAPSARRAMAGAPEA
ncbi:LysM peptidoglycan-binding domain-containing protein [Tessaracoccus sp. MC1679]|uniref:LysM peptidoglycan-binding domain-containing protein n=1 Tax=Tessaracoccus sp. MC1679 TaxID=2760313 RepID=UPI0016000646|nr:LysM peptidoglycan-binding domain-containing protein [Tessaracoccus sp. MC1679]MBB1517244.1 LysM peptidoglycan-binding domain-containing protein [Tessaracoccus sp. MC1679]